MQTVTPEVTATPAVPVTATGGGSTAQIIVIVVLVIIAIVLFVVLLIASVNVPPALVTPFADGSRIRIKSLANNLYLKPVTCSDISNCNDTLFQATCGTNQVQTVIAAVGSDPNDPQIIWSLCQYSGTLASGQPNTGEAKYIVFFEGGQSNQFLQVVQTAQGSILTLQSANGICSALKSDVLFCPDQFIQSTAYFSFLLNEKTLSTKNTSTTSGSYEIANACNLEDKLICTGQGIQNLDSPGCPAFVVTLGTSLSIINCPTSIEPRCALNFLFEIELIS